MRTAWTVLFSAQLLDGPGADAGGLAGVLREVAIGVDGKRARAKHAHQDSERLGVGHPVAAVANGVAPEEVGHTAQRALGGELAHPASLVVDGRWIDPGAAEELLRDALAFLGAHAQEVRLQDRGSELLLARLAHLPAGHGRDGDRHPSKRTTHAFAREDTDRTSLATGSLGRTRPDRTLRELQTDGHGIRRPQALTVRENLRHEDAARLS